MIRIPSTVTAFDAQRAVLEAEIAALVRQRQADEDPDDCCSCSYQPLRDLVDAALAGHVYPEVGRCSKVEFVAKRLTDHLRGEVARIEQQSSGSATA